MKRQQFVFIIICLLLSSNIYSQKLDELLNIKYRTGFAILNNKDTLTGRFEFNDCEQNYHLLVYSDPVTLKKSAYKPQEVKYFSLDTLFYIPKELKEGWEFVQLISNDSLKVYLRKRFFTTNIGSGSENQIMYEKPTGEYLLVSFNNFYSFKTRVGGFFSDDPDLSKKIYNNTYTKNDVLKIALEYNNWLKKNKK